MTIEADGVAETPAIERIARVLASWACSANAEGTSASVGHAVDRQWPVHVDTALAVLKAIREPDAGMAAVGDVTTWRRMVEAAIHGQRHNDMPAKASGHGFDVRNAGTATNVHAGAWSRRDERRDESFPASDMAPINPGVS